jgi:hypothetical protein
MTATLVPMIPGNYSDHVSKVRWDNATAQPQLNGQRCFVYCQDDVVKIVTTAGIEIKSVQHINASLIHAFKKMPEIILDGFLVNPAVKEATFKKYLKLQVHHLWLGLKRWSILLPVPCLVSRQ